MKRLIKFAPYLIIAVVCVVSAIISAYKSDTVYEENDSKKNSPLIILDAGHGGEDGGAVAKDGTEEQYLNLDITLKLNEELKKLGYQTLLTRADDNSIHDADANTVRARKVSDIHNRMKIIEAHPDCIFVSIHQNFFTESKYNGAQVFYSPNNSDSSRLARCIQQSIVSAIQPENTRQIKESGSSIYLLYHSTVPSVLVECGFLSNPEETEKLKDENYRAQMANAVCAGIINYLNGTLPEEESA